MSGSSTVVGTVINPFVGPRPIDTGQKIFGRDREIEQLYYLLSGERIVLLHSPSGAGKSSLIQAGLLPRLTQLFDVWGPTRVNLQPPEDDLGKVNRYVRSVNLGFEARIPKERQRRPELISAMTLSEYVAGRPRRRSAPSNIVLLFDQFEEILTVDPLALEAKHEFFEQVGKLLQDPHVWALFALREDYLAPLDPYAEQVPTHLKNRFRLDLLGREAAREAISRSVEEGGRTIVPEAVGKLVNDLATMQVQRADGTFESQTGPYVEPLHLQVACRGLWERLPEDRLSIDMNDIQSFGDVTKALAEYYEKEVAGIANGDTKVERALREWVGGKLITPDGIRGQVLKGAGESEGLNNELIGRLVDTHLVRGEQRAGAVWYELSHDRLIEPVRDNNKEWFEAHLSKLQKLATVWEAQSRPEGLLLLDADLVDAKQWAAANGSSLTGPERRFLEASQSKQQAIWREQRQARRMRLALAIVAVLAVAAMLAAGWAYLEKQRASESEKKAEISKQRAMVSERSAKDSEKKAIDEKGIADAKTTEALAQKTEAEEQKGIADDKTREAERQTRFALSHQLAAAALSSLDKGFSVQFALHAVTLTLSNDGVVLPDAREALRKSVPARRVALHHYSSPIKRIAFSPDGKRIATVSAEYGITIWDASTGEELINFPKEDAAGICDLDPGIMFSLDGTKLACAGGSVARVWEASTGRELLEKAATYPSSHQRGQVTQFALSSDGALLAIASNGKTIHVALTEVSSSAKNLFVNDFDGRWAIFSPEGKRLATIMGKTIKTWDITTGAELRHFDHSDEVDDAVFSVDGSHLATAAGGTVRIWDAVSGGQLVAVPAKGVSHVAFNRDGTRVATAGEREVEMWDSVSGRRLLALSGSALGTSRLFFSKDGNVIVAMGNTKEAANTASQAAPKSESPEPNVGVLVKAWNADSGKLLPIPVNGNVADLSPDGRHLAIAEGNSTYIQDLSSGQKLLDLIGDDHTFYGAAFSADRTRVAIGSDNAVTVWDVASGRRLQTLSGHQGPVTSIAYSPNGRFLVTASWLEEAAKLRDASSGSVLHELRNQSTRGNIMGVAFRQDSKVLAIASHASLIQLWDTSSFKEIPPTSAISGEAFRGVGFSPNGKLLATTGAIGKVDIWDADSGKRKPDLANYDGTASGILFAKDGERLAAVGDKGAEVWGPGSEWKPLRNAGIGSVPTMYVFGFAFSSDGKQIAGPGIDQTLKMWNSSSGEEVDSFFGQENPVRVVVFSGDETEVYSVADNWSVYKYPVSVEGLIAEGFARMEPITPADCRNYLHFETCPTWAVALSHVSEGNTLAKAGDAGSAIASYRKALEVDPALYFNPEQEMAYLARSDLAARLGWLVWQGKGREAIATYREAGRSSTGLGAGAPGSVVYKSPLDTWNKLCWDGSLRGHAAEVMTYCDLAVAIDPQNGNIRDSRGFARAMVGNVKGAIDDFQFFVDHTDNEDRKSQRQRWVNSLRAGRNPFSPAELKLLLGQ